MRNAHPLRLRLLPLAAALLAAACSPSPAPLEPYGPVPTPEQLAWQRMEINMFCHFGPNTFTGAEWGTGKEDAEVFSPAALDCAQWVDVASQAGMGGIILTAKHHDGFCLWPSRQSTHTVADSLDVLRALRTAIDAHNRDAGGTPALRVQMGVYISPWDRNHPAYGTPQYNDVFVNTLKEVHTQYGPLFEQWFDGACGEGPDGRQQRYDWPRFMQTMRELNPGCVIFSDIGPGCRWVGNEEGRAGEPCWSTLDTAGATPSENKPAPSELETGHPPLSTLHAPRSTLAWVPAECDVSIRPGWFWHPQEHPKTVDELMELYFNSVGRNGLLLLNVPPDTRGRIPAEDSAVLVAFRQERDRLFGNDLAQGAAVRASSHRRGYRAGHVLDTAYHTCWVARDTVATLQLTVQARFDIIMLQEYLPAGQRVYRFEVEALTDGQWQPLCDGTTIGHKRLLRLPQAAKPEAIRITFHGYAPPAINRVALYKFSTR